MLRGSRAWMLAWILAAGLGCRHVLMQSETEGSRRDIHRVLEANAAVWMSVPGVVGVYVGLLPDDRTECIRVMLSRATPEAARRIPNEVEGYCVLTEVTGEIRPLGSSPNY